MVSRGMAAGMKHGRRYFGTHSAYAYQVRSQYGSVQRTMRRGGEATEREPLQFGVWEAPRRRMPVSAFSPFGSGRSGQIQLRKPQECSTGLRILVPLYHQESVTGSRVVGGEPEGARSGSCASDSWDLLCVSVKLELIIFSYMHTV
jgi:hypothetical protein